MFANWNNLQWDVVCPGVRRKVIHAVGFTMAMMELTPEAGSELHAHPHEQSTVVQSGRGEFLVDGEVRPVGPGDVVRIAGGVPHALRVSGPGPVTVFDVFVPRRDEFPASLPAGGS